MLHSYFKVAVRSLFRNRGYASINILGLAIGMASCLTIALYVQGELGYDRHHPGASRIYRVLRDIHNPGQGHEITPRTSGALSDALEEEFPDVESAVRIRRVRKIAISSGTRGFDRWSFAADPDVLSFFNLPLIRGDASTALQGPAPILLTERMGSELFGDVDPMGRQVTVSDSHIKGDYTVTGILSEPTSPTIFEIDFLLVPIRTRENRDTWTKWRPAAWRAVETYVRLRPGTDPDTFERKLPDLMSRTMGEETKATNTWRLQPTTDIYLRSISDFGLERTDEQLGDIRDVYVFVSVAVLILVIACVNYVNLTTARALNRAREVGLRKTVGANRGQLVAQFLGEATAVAVLASILALILVATGLSTINDLTGKDLSLTKDPVNVIVLTAIIFLVGLSAGGYPAFVLSRFDPARVLRGSAELGGGSLRKGLVITQFAIAVALIASTLVIHQQMVFIRSRDLGFDRSLLITIPIFETNRRLEGTIDNTLVHRYAEVRQAFLEHPNVLKASAHRRTPGSKGTGLMRIVKPETDPDTEYRMEIQMVDDAYLDTYGIDLIGGRPFTAFEEARDKVIVNEATLHQFGWTLEEAPGKQIFWQRGRTHGVEIEVLGVMADFNRASVREPVRPMGIGWTPWLYNMITVRVAPGRMPETIAFLESKWNAFLHDRPFEYSFVDENLAQLYRAETNLYRTITVFSCLSILVACLGLFGLAAFTAQQRTQEIGIRKVLGASVTGVILLVSRSFVALVLLASVVGLPVAWVLSRNWLDGFVYRIEVSPGIFLASACLAALVAFAAVLSQAYRAATVDPIRALHHE